MVTDPPPPPRKLWQFRLPTLLLLVAAIAVWIATVLNLQRNARLEVQIEAMLPLARELSVDDPRAVAVVKADERWFGEAGWDVYLPQGSFELGLATRGIDAAGIPAGGTFGRIPPDPHGRSVRHRLSLEERHVGQAYRITLRLDGSELTTVEEPESWYSGSSTSSEDSLELSKQFPSEQPVVLLRRRFLRPDSRGIASGPDGPTEGVMIWIQSQVANGKR